MNGYCRITAGWFLAALSCILGCRDDAPGPGDSVSAGIQKRFEKGPAAVELRLDSDPIALSDLLSLEISVQAGPEIEVRWPTLDGTLGQFQIRDWKDPGRRIGNDDLIVQTRQYHLEPMEAGEIDIPPLEFAFIRKPETEGGEAETIVLTTEALTVKVTTSLSPESEEIAISDIADIVELRRSRLWLRIAICGIAGSMVCFIWIWLRRSKKQAASQKLYKPAHVIALEILRRLAEEKFGDQGRIREFYERLSNCLRHYIEDRFRLRAPEQTTEEFLLALKDSGVLESRHKEALKDFLEHCDLVKFAKYQPTEEQTGRSLEMAELFIENTKSEVCLVELKD